MLNASARRRFKRLRTAHFKPTAKRRTASATAVSPSRHHSPQADVFVSGKLPNVCQTARDLSPI